MADDQAAGTNPPRPGDPVPTGGIDPTQVFASPPPPPPASSGQGDDDGVAPPPEASGPPPPPVGTAATKEMGYDDEDLKILAEVGNYRFGTLSDSLTNDNITVPAHPETDFDEQRFLAALRGSISLTRDEKWRIIQAIPKLSQFQIDELVRILSEEKQKFSELSPKHLKQLMLLEKKHGEDWKDLQAIAVQNVAREQETAQAEEIRKQLGL